MTAAGPEDAYSVRGYQHYPIRTFLTPFECTATLCHMSFTPPYVLYGSLRAPADGQLQPHAEGYRRLLEAVRDDRIDFAAVADRDVLGSDDLPVLAET